MLVLIEANAHFTLRMAHANLESKARWRTKRRKLPDERRGVHVLNNGRLLPVC